MLFTKQYVIFGISSIDVVEQLEKIIQEFDCAGWKIKRTKASNGIPNVIVENKNMNIHIMPCVICGESGIRWDNCWISRKFDRETINNIILPLSDGSTPEIHFF